MFGKSRGLTKSQRDDVTSAVHGRSSPKGSKTRSKARSTQTRKGGKKTTKRKKNRKRPGFTVPLSIVAPIVAIPLVPSVDGWAAPINDAKAGRWHAVGAHIVNGFQPFYQINDPVTFRGKWGLHLPRYLALIVGGVLTHIAASKAGVNKAIARARVPFIRV